MLKQGQYKPMGVESQVAILFAATKGFCDHLPIKVLGRYERDLLDFLESKHKAIMDTLRDKKAIDGDTDKALRAAIEEFNKVFVA
jgi:F-type H+-transporting ATPase subunit alpha